MEKQEKIDEVWEVTLNGFHDDECGNSEYGGWFGLVLGHTDGKSYIIQQISTGLKFMDEYENEQDAIEDFKSHKEYYEKAGDIP